MASNKDFVHSKFLESSRHVGLSGGWGGGGSSFAWQRQVGWFVGRSVGRSVSRSVTRAFGRSVG